MHTITPPRIQFSCFGLICLLALLFLPHLSHANLVNLPAAGDMTFTVSNTLRMEIDADTGIVSATAFVGGALIYLFIIIY